MAKKKSLNFLSYNLQNMLYKNINVLKDPHVIFSGYFLRCYKCVQIKCLRIIDSLEAPGLSDEIQLLFVFKLRKQIIERVG